jgi:hypothetical protein
MTETIDVDISVIVPLNDMDRPNAIDITFADYKRELDKTGLRYEFLFVLEGDQLDEFNRLVALKDGGDPIRIIKLSQSYGDATILTVGFEHARAPILMTLPAYHQIKPEAIAPIVAELGEYDMVTVRRWPRGDSIINRMQTRIFHFLLYKTTSAGFNDLGCGVRVIRRRVTDAVHVYGHKHWFLPVLAGRFGFKINEVDAPQATSDFTRRYFGVGIYFRRMLDLLSIFFLVKFTKKPLRFFGSTGAVLFLMGIAFTAFLTYQRVFEGEPLADRPALLLGVLMIVLGIQIFAIGLIGELIIFTHARDLKEFTIEKIIN